MSLEKAQEQLQNALLTTFLANLSFLNEYDNSLYQRIDALSQMINNNVYKENYFLEFIQKDGDFDIYDKKNDKYIYNKKPSKYNRNASAKIDFTSKGSFSILDRQIFGGNCYTSVFEEVEYFCDFEYSQKLLLNDLSKYIKTFNNNLGDYSFKKYEYIDKFIFIGTLLGRHIPLILEKTKAKDFFVCEENLELFRLSLFVVDYSNLARDGNTVVFSIMDDKHIFNEQIENFLTHKAYQNYNIKFHTTDYNVKEYFDNIMSSILSHKSTSFNYYMMLENMWKNITSRINKYNILQFKQESKDLDFINTPILFIGAGPSLSDNIDWLKMNKDKFIIVSIAAANKILKKNGIAPDIVTTLDPQYKVLKKKHFDSENINFIRDTFVIASINTDQRFLDKFTQNKLFLYEMNKPLHSSNLCYKGFSVGEISASILLGLNFKNIYLLGLDFAINQNTGETHASGYGNKSYNSKLDTLSHDFSFDKELIEIKGNLKEKVYTNRLFSMSLDAMSTNIVSLKKMDQKIYNLSSHGGLIQGTIPLNPNNLDLCNFETLRKELLQDQIQKHLLCSSKNQLSLDDKNDLKNELNYLESVIVFLEELKNKPSVNFEEFDKRIENLIEKLFFPNIECSFLSVIFIHFFNVILQYVYYCLNTQNIIEEEKLKNIEKLFLEDLSRLLGKYTKYLEKV